MPAGLLPIQELNDTTFELFCQVITILFEPAPPLAHALFAKKPFQSYEHLLKTTQSLIDGFSKDDRLVVINSHPRIGAPKTSLSVMSLKEQGYTGQQHVSQEDETVNAELSKWNATYENQHGFKVSLTDYFTLIESDVLNCYPC